MKKITTLILFLFLFLLSCKAQKTKDLSKNTEMNYVFARMYTKNIIDKELYNGGLFVTVFQLSDSKATPENFSEGEEFLFSYIISVTPDGDYYTSSKLFKIEGIINPKILKITEAIYPKFSIKIEHGIHNNRKIETFELEGVK